MRHPISAYRQASVQGATPLGLVVMLYDGAIAAMRRTMAAIEAHDIQSKCVHLNQAIAIIAQLEGSLNFEQGGEVAQTLKALYLYARSQMLKANLQDSAPTVGSLIDKFAEVRAAWHEAEQRPPASSSSPAVAPSSRAPVSTPEPGSWRISA